MVDCSPFLLGLGTVEVITEELHPFDLSPCLRLPELSPVYYGSYEWIPCKDISYHIQADSEQHTLCFPLEFQFFFICISNDLFMIAPPSNLAAAADLIKAFSTS